MTEKLVLGRTHSRLKHLAVFLITVGIMMYTYASSKQVPEHISIFDWIAGTCLISFKFQVNRYTQYAEAVFNNVSGPRNKPYPATLVIAHSK